MASHPPTFNEDRYEAESQVQRAFMDTPLAKRAVRDTMKAIKSQKADTKKLVVPKSKKTGRKK